MDTDTGRKSPLLAKPGMPKDAYVKSYGTGGYWRRRSDLLYYQYFRYMVRCIGHDAQSMIDVGSGNSGYLEWFDWIQDRVSIDIQTPYSSETVRGIEGDIFDLKLDAPYDICSCMQVLEHVPDPAPFARRLLELGRLVLISVPYKWPAGRTKGHVNDPVDLDSVVRWFGRKPNYHIVVSEPFQGSKGSRLIAIFDVADPKRKFAGDIRKTRRPA